MISSDEVIQQVGSKAFVLRNGVWMDTAFDADNQERQEVGFASDVYFELLSAAPELGQFLALGSQVLVVHQGQAYEIVEGPGQGSVTMPDVNPPDEISGTDDRPKDKDKDPSQEDQQNKPALPFCGSALMIPLIFAAVVLVVSKKMLPFA